MIQSEPKIKVTDHAVLQHMKRTRAMEARRNRVRSIVAFGIKVEPMKAAVKAHKLRKHGKPAEYYLKGNMVAVVVDGSTVVTVHESDPGSWALCR
jgi:hypothetical protein